jgi:hypothetical protein
MATANPSSLLGAGFVIGLALGGCHGNRSEQPPVHLIQNMDFQARFDAQEQNDFFQAGRLRRRQVNHGCKGRPPSARRSPAPSPSASSRTTTSTTAAAAPTAACSTACRPRQAHAELLAAARSATTSTASRATTRPARARASRPAAAAASRSRRPTSMTPACAPCRSGTSYDVINNGKGTMLPYAAQIPVEDRWAIAAWVRTLQVARTPEGK